jgi:hypothetical protein
VPLASGSRLGPYEILAPIGAGGGLKARDIRLEHGRDQRPLIPDQLGAHA